MRQRVPVALTFVALVASAVPLAAQAVVMQPGAIVRAELSTGTNDRLVGTLVSRTLDSLTLVTRGSGAIVQVPTKNMRGLEILNGKQRLVPAAKWALIGGGVWGLIAATIPYRECDPARYTNCAGALSHSEFIRGQVFGMAIITGGLGAYRGEDTWTRVEGAPMNAIVIPSSSGTALGLRITF
jgi:hypothetical protein